jgi:hypothetical protein
VIDPKECFWITNAHRMAGLRRLDLRTDPPPDLAIEEHIPPSCLDRLGIYAALSVPEVWRLDGDCLRSYVLGAHGTYAIASASGCFPLVSPADLLNSLEQAREAGNEIPAVQLFRDTNRHRRAEAAK